MVDRRPAALDAGDDCRISPHSRVGVGEETGPTRLGDESLVRAGTILYGDVVGGDRFQTGHNAVVRSGTEAGDDVLVGTQVTVDGAVTMGSDVRLQTGAYLPQQTTLGDSVFFGPHAVVTNDPYPLREGSEVLETTVESNASIGANATLLPGITVGAGSFVGAGAVVTEDLPPETLAVGAPARHEPLPDPLQGRNRSK